MCQITAILLGLNHPALNYNLLLPGENSSSISKTSIVNETESPHSRFWVQWVSQPIKPLQNPMRFFFFLINCTEKEHFTWLSQVSTFWRFSLDRRSFSLQATAITKLQFYPQASLFHDAIRAVMPTKGTVTHWGQGKKDSTFTVSVWDAGSYLERNFSGWTTTSCPGEALSSLATSELKEWRKVKSSLSALPDGQDGSESNIKPMPSTQHLRAWHLFSDMVDNHALFMNCLHTCCII